MNDVPIPSQHGAPLRVIVPGHVGVRNVKWVKTIKISNEEAHGTWQRGMAYKVSKINEKKTNLTIFFTYVMYFDLNIILILSILLNIAGIWTFN